MLLVNDNETIISYTLITLLKLGFNGHVYEMKIVYPYIIVNYKLNNIYYIATIIIKTPLLFPFEIQIISNLSLDDNLTYLILNDVFIQNDKTQGVLTNILYYNIKNASISISQIKCMFIKDINTFDKKNSSYICSLKCNDLKMYNFPISDINKSCYLCNNSVNTNNCEMDRLILPLNNECYIDSISDNYNTCSYYTLKYIDPYYLKENTFTAINSNAVYNLIDKVYESDSTKCRFKYIEEYNVCHCLENYKLYYGTYINYCIETCFVNTIEKINISSNVQICHSCKDKINNKIFDDNCVESCPDGTIYDSYSNICLLCNQEKFEQNNLCVDQCSNNYIKLLIHTDINKIKYYKCVEKCPISYYIEDGYCKTECTIGLSSLPGVCKCLNNKYLKNNQCVEDCGPDMISNNNEFFCFKCPINTQLFYDYINKINICLEDCYYPNVIVMIPKPHCFNINSSELNEDNYTKVLTRSYPICKLNDEFNLEKCGRCNGLYEYNLNCYIKCPEEAYEDNEDQVNRTCKNCLNKIQNNKCIDSCSINFKEKKVLNILENNYLSVCYCDTDSYFLSYNGDKCTLSCPPENITIKNTTLCLTKEEAIHYCINKGLKLQNNICIQYCIYPEYSYSEESKSCIYTKECNSNKLIKFVSNEYICYNCLTYIYNNKCLNTCPYDMDVEDNNSKNCDYCKNLLTKVYYLNGKCSDSCDTSIYDVKIFKNEVVCKLNEYKLSMYSIENNKCPSKLCKNNSKCIIDKNLVYCKCNNGNYGRTCSFSNEEYVSIKNIKNNYLSDNEININVNEEIIHYLSKLLYDVPQLITNEDSELFSKIALEYSKNTDTVDFIEIYETAFYINNNK